MPPLIDPDKLRKPIAFCYVRVSKQKQADNGLSPEEQEDRLRKYCAWKWPDDELRGIEVLVEIDQSSTTEFLKRPVAYELWSRLQTGDHFIVVKADRMSRNLIDTCYMLKKFEEHSVKVHLLDINVDTTSPIGQMIVKVLMIFKEMEIQTIRDNTSKALQWRKEEQRPICYTTPYGYVKVTKGKDKFFVPDPVMQRLGLGALKLYEAGISVPTIVKLYKEWGIRKWDKKTKKEIPWNKNHIFRLKLAATKGFPIHGKPPREELRLDPSQLEGFPLDKIDGLLRLTGPGAMRKLRRSSSSPESPTKPQ